MEMAVNAEGKVEKGNSPWTNWKFDGINWLLVMVAMVESKIGHNLIPNGVSHVGKGNTDDDEDDMLLVYLDYYQNKKQKQNEKKKNWFVDVYTFHFLLLQ